MLVSATPSFNKDIDKINDAKLAKRIAKAIGDMQAATSLSDISGIKKLSGATNAYRIRIADYRLGFTVTDDHVRLIIFAHRKDIYRYFP